MTRRCTICTHPQRGAIDKALIAGEPLRNIVKNVPRCSIGSLHRHKEHLSATLVKAEEAREVASADSLLDQVQDLQRRTLVILRKAELANDMRTALGAIRETRQNLELLARLLGELKEAGSTTNVLLVSPSWIQLRAVILGALEAYPEARLSLSQALKGVDDAGQ